ncbi:MAG TPA: ATP-binding cassette domain-containing protein [Beijerinckiaceae bacterium]|jgi:branched-chain amino acid transport system ATP-binding protein|nr:ATP-binding cassette domain-containing protein [Beijerinckiaceae bacterium]
MTQMPASADLVLETRDMHMAFGGLVIFERMNFSLRRGERHAIIGPNGAGKTTFVSLVTGLLKPKSGAVMFEGRDVTRLSPQERVKAGMVRTFQINSLFRALNPLESVVLALLEREGKAHLSLRHVAAEKSLIGEAMELLHQFGLDRDAYALTEALPYGKQRLLEIVLALALRPKLLLLDEPAAGLSTQQGHEVFARLAHLPDETTILFIEHDMNLVFSYADVVSVFAAGALVLSDTPENVRRSPRVREVYLGN